MTEMENALMSQLEPMPEINKGGEKIGVLVISLTNPTG